MKRARAAKISVVLVSPSGASSGDLGRRGDPVQVLGIVRCSGRGDLSNAYLILIVVAVMVRVRLNEFSWWRGPLVRCADGQRSWGSNFGTRPFRPW
jgi:hypothetical protein